MKKSINIVNKKAKFEYSFLETLIVGIQLVGSEVKSIRQGKVSISEGYCYFVKGELFIKGMNISDYGYGSTHDGDQFVIAICDDCIKENLKDATILYYGNYMYGGDYANDEIEKSKKTYRRRNSLDKLI